MNFLRPNHNVWRIERAARAAVLIDAAAFFEAVRGACLKAERSIFVVGWDIDSRTQLVGADGRPADGLPSNFADFLTRSGADAARPARPSPAVGLFAALCRRTRALAALVAGLADAGPRDALHRQLGPLRQLAAPEDRRGRRCGGLLRRPRPHDPALGHHRPFGGEPPARRSLGPSLPAVPRRPDDGRRRGGAGAGAAGARALVPRQRRRAADRAARRSLAGDGARRISPTSMSASPAPSRATTTRSRCARPRRCSLDSIDLAEREIYIENQFLSSPLIADRLADRLQPLPRARSGDRGAAQPRFLGRAAYHAQRPHPLLAAHPRGRRRPRAAALSRRRAGRTARPTP